VNPPACTVVMGVRAGPSQPQRARNALVVLLALNRQTLERSRYRIVVVEQDAIPHCRESLAPLADQYVFAFNPGPYNRGWGFNVGANLSGRNGLFCFVDSDLVVPGGFLAECCARFAAGARALKPFSTVEYLDRATSNELAAAVRRGASDFTRFRGSAWEAVGGCIWVEGALYRELGGHDERFRGWGAEDKDFWVHLNRLTNVLILKNRLVHLHHEPPEEHDEAANRNRLLRARKKDGEEGWPEGMVGDPLRYAGESTGLPAAGLPGSVLHEDEGSPVSGLPRAELHRAEGLLP
jgi:hypothetical protein